MDKSELKKLGILGGTFDPPHYGHLRIAEEVRESLGLEKVFFIPAGLPPHKKNFKISKFEHRFNMVKLAIKNNPYFEVIDIEKDLIPSYTVNTLKLLNEEFPQTEFFFIVGIDSFLNISTWWNYEEILNYTNLVVVPRKGHKPITEEAKNLAKKLFPKRFEKVIFLDVEGLQVSASKVRELVKRGKSIRYLVPEEVRHYIKEKGLYAQWEQE
ncbi:MAG: nicotinate-nucleotide adenylyltransferase [Thermodesulfobacteria bacterium]|nr:nicotinate-nucleotide adenylyltransferase [Thermodesulfobacteriota bacterium]